MENYLKRLKSEIEMKKILISFLLVITLIFGGCSCSSEATLSFGNEWNNSQAGKAGMKETLTYEVSLSENYSSGDYSFNKSSTLNNIGYDFSGTYTSTLTVLDYMAEIPNADSSVVEEIRENSTQTILYLKTRLDITAKYNLNGGGEDDTAEYRDFAQTEVYFSGSSLSPVYSVTETKFSHLTVSGNEYKVETSHNKNEILYEKNTFVLNSAQIDPEPTTDEEKNSSETVNYNYKTAIDNAELLFALRGFSVKKDSSSSLPVISPTYGKSQTLTVNYYDDQEVVVNMSVNGGTAAESTLSAKCVSFVLAPSGSGCTSCFGNTTTGSPQLVFIQSSTNQSVTENRALVLRYVSPLTAIDGTYSRMGALVYNLKDYTVTL